MDGASEPHSAQVFNTSWLLTRRQVLAGILDVTLPLWFVLMKEEGQLDSLIIRSVIKMLFFPHCLVAFTILPWQPGVCPRSLSISAVRSTRVCVCVCVKPRGERDEEETWCTWKPMNDVCLSISAPENANGGNGIVSWLHASFVLFLLLFHLHSLLFFLYSSSTWTRYCYSLII